MISIIIPLYNKENCIVETIESIQSQSFDNFEIVVVNDGSKDNSVALVESILDDRIRIINKENEGVSKTRNRGISESKGDWILFLDADDLMCEGCLQSLVDLGKRYPEADVLCGNFITKTENQDIKSSIITDNCLINNPFELIWKRQWNLRLGSFMARKTILPLFPVHMAKGEDTVFCYWIMQKNQIAFSPCNTMVYVRENSQLSNKILPLEKCLSWEISFNDTDAYLKSIYLDILIKGIIVYAFKYNKISYSFRLLARHLKNILLYTPKYLLHKMCR